MAAPSLRVLHVLEATLGGTRRYLEDIVAATADLPIAQGLVYGVSRADPGFADLLSHARDAGWYLQPVDALRRAVRPGSDARSIVAVRRAIGRFSPSVVHVHSAKAGAVGRMAALSRWPNRVPVIYSPHALPSRLGAAYMTVERLLAPVTKRFIAVSDSERDEIVAEGIAPRERVDVVYPRIDVDAFVPREREAARTALGLDGGPVVVGIGRLAPQKDPLRFVETIAALQSSLPDVRGIWVGDGELRPDVEALAARLRMGPAFAIAGWTTDVRPYIAAADVVLSTARYESFGYVIPETFAMERPVVASRVTGTIDVFFPEAESSLYEPEDVLGAARAIERIIVNKDLSAQLGRLGRLSVIERFSTRQMSTALSASYEASLI